MLSVLFVSWQCHWEKWRWWCWWRRWAGWRGWCGGAMWWARSWVWDWPWTVLIYFLQMDYGGQALCSVTRVRRLTERLVGGNGAAETVKPLLFVKDIIDLQGVGLRLVWILGTHTKNVLCCGESKNEKLRNKNQFRNVFFYQQCCITFVHIAEGASEGATHSDISILQVLQHQVPHWDWLPVNLETLTLISGDGASQDQKFRKQKHMQLLQTVRIKKKLIHKSWFLAWQQELPWRGKQPKCLAHRATLAAHLAMTQKAFALLDVRIPLPVVKILQLLDVVLALRFSFLRVDVRKNTLNDVNLNTENLMSMWWTHCPFSDTGCHAGQVSGLYLLPPPGGWYQHVLLECVSESLWAARGIWPGEIVGCPRNSIDPASDWMVTQGSVVENPAPVGPASLDLAVLWLPAGYCSSPCRHWAWAATGKQYKNTFFNVSTVYVQR